MEKIFPRPKDFAQVEFMYCVRRNACAVEKVRVLELAPRWVRVKSKAHKDGNFSRRDSRKSLFHEYHFHYDQAKRSLEVDYELKIAKLRNQLKILEDELRSISMTREEDL